MDSNELIVKWKSNYIGLVLSQTVSGQPIRRTGGVLFATTVPSGQSWKRTSLPQQTLRSVQRYKRYGQSHSQSGIDFHTLANVWRASFFGFLSLWYPSTARVGYFQSTLQSMRDMDSGSLEYSCGIIFMVAAHRCNCLIQRSVACSCIWVASLVSVVPDRWPTKVLFRYSDWASGISGSIKSHLDCFEPDLWTPAQRWVDDRWGGWATGDDIEFRNTW